MSVHQGKYRIIALLIIFTMVNTLVQVIAKPKEICGCALPCHIVICERLKLQKIPSDLDDAVMAMVIRFNSISNVRKVDFQNCTNLDYLELSNNNGTPTFEPDALVDLVSLKTLVLDFTHIGYVSLIYPENIFFLSLDSTGTNENNTDLSKLERLELLFLQNNSFTRLPKMNKFAPLLRLNLSGNPLKQFSVKQIARYCSLQEIIIDSEVEAFRKQNCECLRIEVWRNLHPDLRWTVAPGRIFDCISVKLCREKNLISDRMLQLFENCKHDRRIELSDDYDPNFVYVEVYTGVEYTMGTKIVLAVILIIILSTIVVCVLHIMLARRGKWQEAKTSVQQDVGALNEQIKNPKYEDDEF